MIDLSKSDLKRVASELSFEADEEVIEACLDTAQDIKESTEVLYDERPERASIGTRSEDPFNALLDTYEDPRTESESGALSDLSFSIKDTIAVRDLEMTAGVNGFSTVPTFDSVVVERLLEAGATVQGKANLEAFAFGITGENSDFGTVSNPGFDSRVSGGSSSGSAASVAAGLVDASIGTDAGGSVRIPAACCGLVGAKPTHGLVPRHGLVDFAPSMDTIGPITDDVRTAADVLEVIRGHDLRDPSSSRVSMNPVDENLNETPQITFGLPESLFDQSSQVVREAVADVAAAAGEHPSVETRSVPLGLGSIKEAYPIVAATEFSCVLRQNDSVRGQGTGYEEQLRRALSTCKETGIEASHMIWRVLPVAVLDEMTNGRLYMAARREVISLQQRLQSVFDDVDLLLTPTLQRLPPAPDEITTSEDVFDMLGNTSVFNLTGNPGVAVPIGTAENLPVSAQIVGPHFEDGLALKGARLLERLGE